MNKIFILYLFQTRAQFALDFVLEHLPSADRTTQSILLRDATILCSTYPVLFNEKVLACVRKKNNLAPSSTTTLSTSSTVNSSSGATMVTMTNSVVTSFDEETTTTTTPVAIMKPVISRPANKDNSNRVNGNLALTNGATMSSTTTTSGGVTIVKLNVAPPPVLQSNQVDSTVNAMVNGHEKVASESRDKDKTGNGVVSSSTTTASGLVNGGPTSPPHTG